MVRLGRQMAAAALLLALVQPSHASECDKIDSLPDPFGIPYNTIGGTCSGSGTCESGVCVCEDGWTGRSDFINTEGEDCHINEAALQGLWAFALLLCVVNSVQSAPRIKLRWQQFQETKERKMQQGQKYGLRNNRGMATILVCFGVVIPTIVATAILMIARPGYERIGLTPAATILFGIGKAGFYAVAYIFQPALIASILRGSRATRNIVRATYSISAVLSGMGVLGGFAPIVTLALSEDGKDDVAVAIFYVYFIMAFLQVLGLGIQAYWTKVRVVQALSLSYSVDKSQRTKDIMDALVAVERENITQCVVQGTVFLLFAIVPDLANGHSYFWPIGWYAYIILSKKAAFTTVADSKYGTRTGTGGTFTDSKDESKSKDGPTSTYVSVVGSPPGAPPAPPSPAGGTGLKGTTAERFQKQVPSFVEQQESVQSASESDFV